MNGARTTGTTATKARPKDGTAWVDTLPDRGELRVLRGGSYFDSAVDCRPAHRNRDEPGNRSDLIGFRLCLPCSTWIASRHSREQKGPEAKGGGASVNKLSES